MTETGRERAEGSSRLRVAVLVSGEGTTMTALAERSRAHEAPFQVVLVASDRPGAVALERARSLGIPTTVLPLLPRLKDPPDPEGLPAESAWAAALRERGVQLLVLAGFLKVFRGPVLREFSGRILNTHPALLPRYGGAGMYGSHVHEAVLRAGERETGATVHLVTESLDAGPVIAQARIPVLTGDDPASLAARLRPVEHRLLIQVVEDFARGRLPLPFSTPPGEPPGGSGG
ncbi:phosphoribosylglycinamide formyltransferase [mine drainage metagenome]|uniref:phosphoribosylglycinamide formyltransferase 1 n=1 Tax=mine drainage metagenome TaxID=410659 RepID=T1BMS6_9ZZZZ